MLYGMMFEVVWGIYFEIMVGTIRDVATGKENDHILRTQSQF
jgi:hypothetical protein